MAFYPALEMLSAVRQNTCDWGYTVISRVAYATGKLKINNLLSRGRSLHPNRASDNCKHKWNLLVWKLKLWTKQLERNSSFFHGTGNEPFKIYHFKERYLPSRGIFFEYKKLHVLRTCSLHTIEVTIMITGTNLTCFLTTSKWMYIYAIFFFFF